MAITVLQVIDTALGIAQLDASFRPQARLYYNLSLRELASDFDWPEYNKVTSTQSFLTGQTEYDLPEDYFRADNCYLMSGANRGRQIKIVDKTLFDSIRVGNPSTSGAPRIATIDQGTSKIIFESVPAQDGYVLRYFRRPVEIDTSGGDDALTPDFTDEISLIHRISQWCMDYTDDDRYQRKAAETDKSLRDTKFNIFDTDDNSIVNLNTSVHTPGRRPSRGGGGSGSSF